LAPEYELLRAAAGKSLFLGFGSTTAGAAAGSVSSLSLFSSVCAGFGGMTATGRGAARGMLCSTDRLAMSTTCGAGSADGAALGSFVGRALGVGASSAALPVVAASCSGWWCVRSERTKNAPEPEAATHSRTARATVSQRGCSLAKSEAPEGGNVTGDIAATELEAGLGSGATTLVEVQLAGCGTGVGRRAGTGVDRRAGTGVGSRAGRGVGSRAGTGVAARGGCEARCSRTGGARGAGASGGEGRGLGRAAAGAGFSRANSKVASGRS